MFVSRVLLFVAFVTPFVTAAPVPVSSPGSGDVVLSKKGLAPVVRVPSAISGFLLVTYLGCGTRAIRPRWRHQTHADDIYPI